MGSKISALRRAYLHWLAVRPEPGRTCCDGPHFNTGWESLADEYICEREKAWREYVRLRDENPDYPFKRLRS